MVGLGKFEELSISDLNERCLKGDLDTSNVKLIFEYLVSPCHPALDHVGFVFDEYNDIKENRLVFYNI